MSALHVNTETGEEEYRELSAEEEAAHLATQTDAQARMAAEAAAAARRADDLALLAAHAAANPDDPMALLAKALGLV